MSTMSRIIVHFMDESYVFYIAHNNNSIGNENNTTLDSMMLLEDLFLLQLKKNCLEKLLASYKQTTRNTAVSDSINSSTSFSTNQLLIFNARNIPIDWNSMTNFPTNLHVYLQFANEDQRQQLKSSAGKVQVFSTLQRMDANQIQRMTWLLNGLRKIRTNLVSTDSIISLSQSSLAMLTHTLVEVESCAISLKCNSPPLLVKLVRKLFSDRSLQIQQDLFVEMGSDMSSKVDNLISASRAEILKLLIHILEEISFDNLQQQQQQQQQNQQQKLQQQNQQSMDEHNTTGSNDLLDKAFGANLKLPEDSFLKFVSNSRSSQPVSIVEPLTTIVGFICDILQCAKARALQLRNSPFQNEITNLRNAASCVRATHTRADPRLLLDLSYQMEILTSVLSKHLEQVKETQTASVSSPSQSQQQQQQQQQTNHETITNVENLQSGTESLSYLYNLLVSLKTEFRVVLDNASFSEWLRRLDECLWCLETGNLVSSDADKTILKQAKFLKQLSLKFVRECTNFIEKPGNSNSNTLKLYLSSIIRALFNNIRELDRICNLKTHLQNVYFDREMLTALTFLYWDVDNDGESESVRWKNLGSSVKNLAVCAHLLFACVLIKDQRQWRYAQQMADCVPTLVQVSREMATTAPNDQYLPDSIYEDFLTQLKAVVGNVTRVLERFVECAFSLPAPESLNANVQTCVISIQQLLTLILEAQREISRFNSPEIPAEPFSLPNIKENPIYQPLPHEIQQQQQRNMNNNEDSQTTPQSSRNNTNNNQANNMPVVVSNNN